MDRRSMLRGGRRDPGPTGKAFSREDVYLKRLYLGDRDDTLFTINSSTRSSQTHDSDSLICTLNSESDAYTSCNINGWTTGVSNPKTFYNSAGCSWKMYDIFGNPVYPNSPVIMQWAVELTDARGTAGDYPTSGSGTAVKSFCSLGVTDKQVSSLESGTSVASVGHFISGTGNSNVILGVHNTASNMPHTVSGGEIGRTVLGTVMMGPKTATGDCYIGPIIGGHYCVADAGAGDGTNTETGQAVTAFRGEQYDPGNADKWNESNQLHWIFGMGRQTQNSTSNTDVEWRFRLWARAIPLCATSSVCTDLRLLGKTW